MKLDQDGSLQFPCRYPVKAIARAGPSTLEQVLQALSSHGVDPENAGEVVRPSRNGRFQSITVPVHAQSRSHLEAVYASLRATDGVVMTL